MSVAGKIITFAAKRSARRFEPATYDPVRAQREKLMALIRKNEGTEYGRRYGFASIRSFSDYQRQVPVITYADIRSDMERVMDGASGVFTVEDPIMFAQTSGTTGNPKFIPVTPTCNGADHKDTFRTWLHHARKDHPGIFDLKVVSLVSPAVEGYAPSGVPFGSTSGQIYRSMPKIVKTGYSIPYEAFEISDYQAKYYTIMRISVEDDISLLITANPSTVLKMCQKADEFSEDIIADIRDGTLSTSVEIAPEIRASLAKTLRPNPERAAQLEEARSRRHGVLRPGDYWPRLGLIGCWKGGTVGHYLDKFPGWFDPDGERPVPVRDLGYLSSEARGSIPLSDEGSQGVLTVAANFFEFVEVEQLESNRDRPVNWDFLTVGDIEEGGEYYIFVTTTGGLYRYDINDVIKVVGLYNQTPQIIFLRKGRGMTNITGEKLSVNQVIEAVQYASQATGAAADHFKAEADVASSRYVLRVEFNGLVGPDDELQFLEAVDKHLKDTNIEYKAKRDSQRLHAPVLHVMREGWYERSRKQYVESGNRAFQVKTQVLSPVKQMTIEVRPELVNVIELAD